MEHYYLLTKFSSIKITAWQSLSLKKIIIIFSKYFKNSLIRIVQSVSLESSNCIQVWIGPLVFFYGFPRSVESKKAATVQASNYGIVSFDQNPEGLRLILVTYILQRFRVKKKEYLTNFQLKVKQRSSAIICVSDILWPKNNLFKKSFN